MFGSSRSGGSRGGQDQFNWNDVKVDKHRENYLGKCCLQFFFPPYQLYTDACHMARTQVVVWWFNSTTPCFHTFYCRVPHYTVEVVAEFVGYWFRLLLYKVQVLAFICPCERTRLHWRLCHSAKATHAAAATLHFYVLHTARASRVFH